MWQEETRVFVCVRACVRTYVRKWEAEKNTCYQGEEVRGE